MTDQDNKPNDDGLENLPEKERKDTEEIIKEIEGEAKPVEPKPGDEKPKDSEKKLEDKSKEGEGQPEKPADKKPEGRKTPKLIPAYIHEIEKGKMQKEIDRLSAELAKKGEGKPEQGKENKAPEDLTAKVKAFAEKHGVTEDFARDILESVAVKAAGGEIPADVQAKIAKIDELAAQSESDKADREFNQDFDAKILPLIKAEYGDNVPSTTIEELKAEFKEKSHEPDFSKVPFEIIYKGDDGFRNRIPKNAKGAEHGRGGTGSASRGGGKEALDLTKPLPDDVVANLSDADFDTYSDNMAKSEKNS